jgi:predicted outer membrane repeat protein
MSGGGISLQYVLYSNLTNNSFISNKALAKGGAININPIGSIY